MISANSQAIQQHPLRNSLNSLQTPNVLTELAPESIDDDQQNLKHSGLRASIIGIYDRVRSKMKNRKRTMIRRSSEFAPSVHEMDNNNLKDTNEQKAKLTRKMMDFLSKLRDDELRKKKMSSSFWFAQKEPEHMGQLIKLKTLGSKHDSASKHVRDNLEEQISANSKSDSNDTAQSISQRVRENRLCLKPWILNPLSGSRQAWDLCILSS